MITEEEADFVVRGAYLTLLGREPDAVGLDLHKRKLLEGSLSIGDLYQALRNSGESLQLDIGGKPETLSTSKHEFRLTDSYLISGAEWDGFLGELFSAHLLRKAVRHSVKRLIVVCEVDDASDSAIERTRHSLVNLRSAAAFEVNLCFVGSEEKTQKHDLDARFKAAAASVKLFQSLNEISTDCSRDDLLMFMYMGDAPRPELAPALSALSLESVSFITTDAYFLSGSFVFPILHPGANPTLLMNVDYVFSRLIAKSSSFFDFKKVRRNKITRRAIDVFRDWLTSRTHGDHWKHIHLPLMDVNLNTTDLRKRREALISREPMYVGTSQQNDLAQADVSIVICTKDKGHLLEQLVTRIIDGGSSILREIVIVSNNTTNAYANAALKRLQSLSSLVKVVTYPGPFNFSAQCNVGVGVCSGSHLLMLNDDIAPINAGWLESLLDPFCDPDVGIVGPLLLYPDESVQHAGMFMGFRGSAGHTLRHARLPGDDYLFYSSSAREVSAVTGAAMMISRSAFAQCNGFDELLASFLQDVDLCMRLARSGYKIVFTPASRLIHMESASVRTHISDHRVAENRGREHAYFSRRWGKSWKIDPFFNPMLDSNDESMRTLKAY